MADAINVPAAGFNIPAPPASAEVHERVPSPQQVPGYVNPAPAGITQAQVQEQIAAAIKAAQPQAAAVPLAGIPDNGAYNSDAVTSANDPVLSSLTDVFLSVGAGIDMERALGQALSRGDSSLIDLAYITEKGGAAGKQLAVLAKAIVERVQTQTAAASGAVYETAGGQAQWDAAASVFDKQAPKHLKMVIAQMLDSGNSEAIKAAAQSVVDYVKQSGVSVNPAQLIHAGASSANAGQALSKAEFQEAHSKLDQNSRTYLQDRDALFGRRSLGKQLGR
jgi:hypothetical protein